MKKYFILILMLIIVSPIFSDLPRQKPYIMAGYEDGKLDVARVKIESILEEKGFSILGSYSPMKDPNRMVIILSHPILILSVKKIGGITAFASIFRVGLLRNGSIIEVSYLNPLYWGNAYYRKSFPDVEQNYLKIKNMLLDFSKKLKTVKNYQYGSKKGLTIKKLRKYHYMIFMPYFDDVIKLAKKTVYKDVLQRIENNFQKKIGDVEKVYRLDIPGMKLTLFGGALYGKDGESKFIPKIDKYEPKHVTFMPYEFLVMENRVVMLHGKFRIALSFPDLSLGKFMKIVSTPGNIADYFEDIVKK